MKKIITHNGTMHTDEIFAIAILLLWAEKNQELLEIIRTRDSQLIDSGDFVIDVGGIYDPNTNRFDHHQQAGAGQRDNNITYASAGLLWKHYGMELTNDLKIWSKIDEKIIQPIDAGDNGINTYTVDTVEPFTFHSVVGLFNSAWNEDEEIQNKNFFEMIELAKKILKRAITKNQSALLAEEKVLDFINNREIPQILVLDNNYPYGELLENYPEILFVVFPEKTNNSWHIKALPLERHSFAVKKPFPENWRGQEISRLKELSGIEGIKFCHRAGFLCVADDKKSALDIARASI